MTVSIFLLIVLLLHLQHLSERRGLDLLQQKFMSIILIHSPLDGLCYSLHLTYESSLFGGFVSRLGLP